VTASPGLARLAFAAGAALGAAAGWYAERHLLRRTAPADDPLWVELREPLGGRIRQVRTFDGTVLETEQFGRTEEDAPTIVLAHGYAMSRQTWRFQCRDLAEDFRVVAYDHRGHGGSEPAASGDYSIEALGRDLDAVLDSYLQPGQQAVVAGHSMGGMTILSLADQVGGSVPQRLAGAVFVDSTGGDVIANAFYTTSAASIAAIEMRIIERVWQMMDRRAHLLARAYAASSDLSYLITRWVALSRHAHPAVVAFVEQQWLDCGNSVKAALGPTVTGINLREAGIHLAVPSLVIVGVKDRLTPRSQAVKLAEALPDADLLEIPDVGHTAQMEAHDEVTKAIRELARRAFGPAA
jgi:pimeloyl-ACP methyl ester carboxylesterase